MNEPLPLPINNNDQALQVFYKDLEATIDAHIALAEKITASDAFREVVAKKGMEIAQKMSVSSFVSETNDLTPSVKDVFEIKQILPDYKRTPWLLFENPIKELPVYGKIDSTCYYKNVNIQLCTIFSDNAKKNAVIINVSQENTRRAEDNHSLNTMWVPDF